MTSSPRIWFATYTALVLIIGASAGVLGAHLWLAPGHPGPPFGGAAGVGSPVGPPPQQIVDELDRALHFTDEQRAEVRQILDTHLPRAQALQKDAHDRFVAEQDAVHAEISAILTPEQLTQFRLLAPHVPPGPAGRGRGGPGRGGMPPPGRGRQE